MDNPQFVRALLCGIAQNLPSQKKYIYIGSIANNLDEFYLVKNVGQELAARKFEEIQKQQLLKKVREQSQAK